MTVFATRLTSGTDTAERVRLTDSLNVAPTGMLDSRSGFRPGGGAVSVVDSTMDVEVEPCVAWINGDSSPQQAGYPVVVNATETVTLSDGAATGDRIDLLVLRVHDSLYDGGGAQEAAIEVVEGVPGDSSAPDTPDTALALREVTVPEGVDVGSGGLTSTDLGSDRRVYTASLGGIVPVANAIERDTLSRVPGLAALQLDNGALYVSDGDSWQPVSDPDNRPQAGTRLGEVEETETRYNARVDFARPFSAPPVVTAQSQDVSWVDQVRVGAYNIDENGFTLRWVRISGGAGDILCGWQAIPATQ